MEEYKYGKWIKILIMWNSFERKGLLVKKYINRNWGIEKWT